MSTPAFLIVSSTWLRADWIARKRQTPRAGSARNALSSAQCAHLQPTALARRQSFGGSRVWAIRAPRCARHAARNDFAALPAICKRWSPDWDPDPKEFDPVRASFSNRASLNAAFGYYRKLSPIPSASLKARITVPTVVFAGLDDPVAEPSDYRGAARMFENEYIVEEVPGGHFMHREHPDAFAERLLTHL